MEVFVVMDFILCDDRFYGYNQHLLSIFLTYDHAKSFVDSYLLERKYYNKNDKDFDSYGCPFIRIIKKDIGGTSNEIMYDSMDLNEKSAKITNIIQNSKL